MKRRKYFSGHRLRLDERRHWAVEGFGDGAEEFGFGFLDDAVGGDDLGAGVDDVLFDLRDGLVEAI